MRGKLVSSETNESHSRQPCCGGCALFVLIRVQLWCFVAPRCELMRLVYFDELTQGFDALSRQQSTVLMLATAEGCWCDSVTHLSAPPPRSLHVCTCSPEWFLVLDGNQYALYRAGVVLWLVLISCSFCMVLPTLMLSS